MQTCRQAGVVVLPLCVRVSHVAMWLAQNVHKRMCPLKDESCTSSSAYLSMLSGSAEVAQHTQDWCTVHAQEGDLKHVHFPLLLYKHRCLSFRFDPCVQIFCIYLITGIQNMPRVHRVLYCTVLVLVALQ